MQVTRAAIEDAHAIAEIHVASRQSAYAAILPTEYLASLSVEESEARWRKCILEGTSELLVAKNNGIVLGWLNFGKCRDQDSPPHNAEIWALYVSPESWSTGIGRALWVCAKALMLGHGFESCSLWVFPQNSRAIKFYQAAGFSHDSVLFKSFEVAGKQLQEVRYVRRLDA